jgi:hypothetical protein
MTHSLPPLPESSNEDTSQTNTQRTRPQSVPPRSRPSAPIGQPHIMRPQPHLVSSDIRRLRPPRRRRSMLVLPWWSILVMLAGVMTVVFGIAGLFVALGQRATPQAVTPIIRIITAQPTAPQAQFPQATSAPLIQLPGIGNGAGQLALEGPTLPPVLFTNTPVPITVGITVVVNGVGANQLNVRDRAGLRGTTVLFRAPDGTRFTVIGGPQQADNFIWWQIEDVNNPANRGWAVSNYLQVSSGS